MCLQSVNKIGKEHEELIRDAFTLNAHALFNVNLCSVFNEQ